MQPSLILDIVLLAYLAYLTFTGFRSGFTIAVLGIIGLALGAAASFFMIPLVLGWVPLPAARFPIILAAIIGLTSIGQAAGKAVGRKVRASVKIAPLRVVDRSLGGLTALVIAALALPLLTFGVNSLAVPVVTEALRSSQVIATITDLTPTPMKAFTAKLQSLVSQNGLPRLIEAIAPSSPITVPSTTVETAAQKLAAKSVVKVKGSAVACAQSQSGSGFVVAPNRIITNAHVVAGVDDPQVEIGDNTYPAQVVYFDPQNDIAIVAVTKLGIAALPVAATVPVGTVTIVAGYPRGGPYTAKVAVIQQVSKISISDIYGNRKINREVYYLGSDVQQGNSGGPVISATGAVVGLVFAKSSSTNNLGFALTMTELAPVSAAAPTYSEAVSSGRCTKE